MGVIYLIRHGQASFGAADYDRLSELGQRQSELLGRALAARIPAPRVARSGTLTRHRQTAETCLRAMAEQSACPTDPGFDEFDFGEVIERARPEYRDRERLHADIAARPDPAAAFQELFGAAVTRWVSGRHDSEYRETWPAFRNRCATAVERLAATLEPGVSALVFTSGGPITAIVQGLLNIPDRHAFVLSWSLTNCGVTKLINGRGGLAVSTLNEHGPFESAGAELLTYR